MKAVVNHVSLLKKYSTSRVTCKFIFKEWSWGTWRESRLPRRGEYFVLYQTNRRILVSYFFRSDYGILNTQVKLNLKRRWCVFCQPLRSCYKNSNLIEIYARLHSDESQRCSGEAFLLAHLFRCGSRKRRWLCRINKREWEFFRVI